MRLLLGNLIFCTVWVRKDQNFSLRLGANVNVTPAGHLGYIFRNQNWILWLYSMTQNCSSKY